MVSAPAPCGAGLGRSVEHPSYRYEVDAPRGKLTRHGEVTIHVWSRLSQADGPAVERLNASIREEPSGRAFLSPTRGPLLAACLSGSKGHAIGAWADRELVAYRLVHLASALEDFANCRAYKEWPADSPDPTRAVHFCGIAVHPAYRRRGMGLSLTRAAMVWAAGTARRYAVTSSHPANHGSLAMLELAGFLVIGRTAAGAGDHARLFLAAPLPGPKERGDELPSRPLA